jgi:hypothetical protein
MMEPLVFGGSGDMAVSSWCKTPSEAQFSEMPENVLIHVDPNYVVRLNEMPDYQFSSPTATLRLSALLHKSAAF